MNIKQIVSGYASSNTYFINKDNKMVVVDPCLNPNDDATTLLESIKGFEVEAILITHGHFDHISGIDAIVEQTNCPVYVFHKESDWLSNAEKNLCFMIPETVEIKSKPTEINLGPLELPNFKFEVILTPGHTSGSVSYVMEDHIFDGDFIFKDSMGRTDLPTGSESDMETAMLKFIEKYEDSEMTLHPGHGPQTTLKREIQLNPYLRHILKTNK